MNQTALHTLQENWNQHFDGKPSCLIQAPGRINLMGEHVDYNHGYVLPAAIAESMYGMFGNNGPDGKVSIYAIDKQELLEIDIVNSIELPTSAWQKYAVGVVAEFRKLGVELDGLQLVFYGDIPIGAGLSSSAALCVCLASGIDCLFETNMTKKDVAFLSQRVEQDYVGVQCGLMDQMAVLLGKKDTAILLDCIDYSHQHIPLSNDGYEWQLVNSKVAHQLAASAYNLRRQESGKAIQLLSAHHEEVFTYRQVDRSMLNTIKNDISPVAFKRAQYVIEELNRVKQAISFIEEKDWESFGNLMFGCHFGLRDLFEVTCPQTDLIVEVALKHKDVIGARQMGGGFGGCVLLLSKKDSFDTWYKAMEKKYKEAFNLELEAIEVHIGPGTTNQVI